MIDAATMCSGIGAPEMAMPGWRWLWCAEIEPFASAVLDKRFGHANLGDITDPQFSIRAAAIGVPRVIVAGTPCQAFSVAGKRKGLSDERGNLTLKFTEICHALADAARLAGKPRPCVLWENVPGVLSDESNAFGCFLGEIVGADDALSPPRGEGWPRSGMVSGPRARAAWRVLDAQHFGLAQRRERVFVVIDFGDGPDPAAVLFERKGLPGDYSPRVQEKEGSAETGIGAAGRGSLWQQVREAFADPRFGVQRVAGTIGGASQSGGFRTTDLDNNGALIPEVAWALQERDHKGADSDTKEGHLIPVVFKASHYTRGKDGAPASITPPLAVEDDRGDQSPLVLAPVSLEKMQVDTFQPIAINIRGREHGVAPEVDDKASLRAASGGSSRSYVAAFHGTQDPDFYGDLAPPIGTNHGQECAIAISWAIRRLTPVECARLQGFPDHHTRIEWRGKPESLCPDGPQYKGFGNSMAVAVINWICERIERSIEQ